MYIMLHGGGMSALSFALFARELCARDTDAHAVAIDFRGHGETDAPPYVSKPISPHERL